MASVVGALRGGWFPENWSAPLGIGLGVVITGFLGDTVAGFIGQFVPAEWLNPASEFVVGILLFIFGGYLGGDMSMWLRLFSVGAFAVAIADTVSIILGLVTAPPAVAVAVRRQSVQPVSRAQTVRRITTY